jgi:plastocyanin
MEMRMKKLTMTAGLALLSILQGACADRQVVTSPISSKPRASLDAAVSNDRVVSIFDMCDGPSFNDAGFSCTRTAGVTVDQLIAELKLRQTADEWHFAASNVNVFAGQTLDVVNRGGETHTFTEVKQFGGGQFGFLNDLSGNPVEAPECVDAKPIAAGATQHETISDEGDELYQCCIHPWMRVVIHASHHA